MSAEPVIAFGQQPCGFLPRRFLVAKIRTARRMQAELGGRIVFFCHDSDHDSRETRTILRHRTSGKRAHLNFAVASKCQRKYSPLYAKRIAADWQDRTAAQLTNYVERRVLDLFRETAAATVADFCLDMYRRMGLLDGVQVTRSSDPALRRSACDVGEFFVDVPYQGELVRARMRGGALSLHAGGESYVTLPPVAYTKEQISPTRDSRLVWMQSIIGCTHYVCGAGEQMYMHQRETPEITFVPRDEIDRPDEAYVDLPG